ncbi:unnamed protein product [Coregonus sp. 'balchen']|nr:unnamed protein product [Coregonus sp. 'balchen']
MPLFFKNQNVVNRLMRKGNYAERVGAVAPVYLAAVLEYLTTEILELAGDTACANKKTHIIPCHLQLAFRNDEDPTSGRLLLPQEGPRMSSKPTSWKKKYS